MNLRIVLASLLIGLLPAHVPAQNAPQHRTAQGPEATPAVPEPKIDPAKEANIRHLIDVMGGAKMMDDVMAQMFAQLRPLFLTDLPPGKRGRRIEETFLQKVQAKVKGADLIELLIPIYAKYFTDEDIKGLTQFYESPAGRHYVQVRPQVAGESLATGLKWGHKIVDEVWLEMEAEFPELKSRRNQTPPNP